MTALERDVPSVPLTMGERDAFALIAAFADVARCRFCRKAATGVCGCCCPEHDTPPPRPVTRHYTLHARLRQLARRVAVSPFAGDLRRAWRAAFWPAVACSGLFIGLYLVYATRGSYVAWDGVHSIPTGGTR